MDTDNKKVKILDCTLRDGGYVNDWCFIKAASINIINIIVFSHFLSILRFSLD